MVEGTGLENRRAVKRTEGSNPSPSAKTVLLNLKNRRFIRVSYFLLVIMEIFISLVCLESYFRNLRQIDDQT